MNSHLHKIKKYIENWLISNKRSSEDLDKGNNLLEAINSYIENENFNLNNSKELIDKLNNFFK